MKIEIDSHASDVLRWGLFLAATVACIALFTSCSSTSERMGKEAKADQRAKADANFNALVANGVHPVIARCAAEPEVSERCALLTARQDSLPE